jgi:hypothetical protein
VAAGKAATASTPIVWGVVFMFIQDVAAACWFEGVRFCPDAARKKESAESLRFLENTQVDVFDVDIDVEVVLVLVSVGVHAAPLVGIAAVALALGQLHPIGAGNLRT